VAGTISRFWIRWLVVLWGVIIVMGLALIFTPLVDITIGSHYYNQYFDYDAYAVISDGDLRFQTFLYGISGAVLASWAIVMLFLVLFPLRQGQRWAWYAIFLSACVWFIGDGYASVATGFTLHAFLNLGLFIPLMIPLFAIYRQTQ